jgi:hypothetical protein
MSSNTSSLWTRHAWLSLAVMACGLPAMAQQAPAQAPNGPPPGMASVPEVDRSKDCDVTCLRGIADQYLNALTAHDPALLKAVAPSLRAAENSHAVALGDNIWKTVVQLRAEKSYFTDPYAGQVLVTGVFEMRASEAFIYAIRLKVEKGLISESETMVTADKIAGQHFRPDLMPALQAQLSTVVPNTARLSRTELLKAARINWGAEPGTQLPAADSCLRYENGESPMGGKCEGGTGRTQRNFRTPLVDVEHGVVVGYQLEDFTDPQPRDPPPGRAPEKTPTFYYRPLSFYAMRLSKIAAGQRQAEAIFMNAQEVGVGAVFRR